MGGQEIHKEKKVNSKYILKVAALGIAGVLGTSGAWAQAAPAAAGGPKVGVLSVRQAIVATAEGKQASAELQSQFAPRQNELEGLNKQINDLRARLSAGTTTLSDEEKARLGAQGQKLAAQLERKNTELQEDVNAAQGEVVDRIGRKMIDVLDRYARENGFAMVLDSSAQNSPILYASNNIDVTQDIVKLYDQAYPLKGGATAPATKPAPKPAAPAAAKPAAPPAAKP